MPVTLLTGNRSQTVRRSRVRRMTSGSPLSVWATTICITPTLWRRPAANRSKSLFCPTANQDVNSIHWAAAGNQLLFTTKQRTELGHIARVTFVEDPPTFAEDTLRRTVPNAPSGSHAHPKPPATSLNFQNIRNRTRLSPLGPDIQELVISRDGKWIVFAAKVPANNDPGDQRVYAIATDAAFSDSPSAPTPTLLAATSGSKQYLRFSPDGKEKLFFLDGTHIAAATLDPPSVRTIAATCELDVDVEKENKVLLNDTWSYLGENYYTPKMNGVDWDGLLRDHFRDFVHGTTSATRPAEF